MAVGKVQWDGAWTPRLGSRRLGDVKRDWEEKERGPGLHILESQGSVNSRLLERIIDRIMFP